MGFKRGWIGEEENREEQFTDVYKVSSTSKKIANNNNTVQQYVQQFDHRPAIGLLDRGSSGRWGQPVLNEIRGGLIGPTPINTILLLKPKKLEEYVRPVSI